MFKSKNPRILGKIGDVSVELLDQPTDTLAPDLRMAQERLQPDWILEWLREPLEIQPGTRMPMLWTELPGSFYPQFDSDGEQQIEAIRDYLLTFRGGPSPIRGN